MKLVKVLDRMGSLEKNSFIKIIDQIISSNPKEAKRIDNILNDADKGLKSVDNENIAEIFKLIKDDFKKHIIEAFQEPQSQIDILIDIIIRDGNCILKRDWFSRLYEKEVNHITTKVARLEKELEQEKTDLSPKKKRDLKIYKNCLETAYHNDIANNRDPHISDEEQSILLTLGNSLDLSQDEIKTINYIILPVHKLDVQEAINTLKKSGLVFYSKKESKLYIPDEFVRLLRKIRGIEVADKYYRRTLKLMRVPVINLIARKNDIDRKLSHDEKIEAIIKNQIPFSRLLAEDMHKEDSTLTERKVTLNEIFEKGLNIDNLKGKTSEEKIENLIEYFEKTESDEKVGIAYEGYEKLLNELGTGVPSLNERVKKQFEFNEDNVLKADFLIDFNLKPRDILEVLTEDELKTFIKDHGIKQRGDNILNTLEHYRDAENLYIENYENVAFRNLNLLKENGIELKESELGLKFESITESIFSNLGFNVDNDLKNSLNTRKDKMDILLNMGNDEIIIVECKTIKEKGYNKFSSVSRQLKSYQSLALKNDLRILKVLLIAPEFSDDFIYDCEMDTELNLSLIPAKSLIAILNAYKDSKYKEFPHVLFRDVIVNENRIVKALNKG